MHSQEEFPYFLPEIIDLTGDDSNTSSTISVATTQESIEAVLPESPLSVLKEQLEERGSLLERLSNLNKTWWKIQNNPKSVQEFRKGFAQLSAPIRDQMRDILANPIIEDVKTLVKEPNTTKAGISNQFKNENDVSRKDLLSIADRLIKEEKKYHGVLSKHPSLRFTFISSLPEGKTMNLSSGQQSISIFCSSGEGSRALLQKTKDREDGQDENMPPTVKKALTPSAGSKKNKNPVVPPPNNTSILNFFSPKKSTPSTNGISPPST